MSNNIKKYEPLIVAFGSYLFINSISPLLDALCSWGINAINKSVSKMQMQIELDKCECQAAAETIAPAGSSTQAIGFNIEQPIEYDYDEEYRKRK